MDDPQPFPEPHVILPTSIHTHTVVLLHGRGSNGGEFADEFFQGETSSEESLLQLFPGFKWIFPTAHQSFSTVFQEDLVEWFDIYSLTDPSSREELQIDGLRDSVAFIQGLIDKEVQAWGPSAQDRIILGGKSRMRGGNYCSVDWCVRDWCFCRVQRMDAIGAPGEACNFRSTWEP